MSTRLQDSTRVKERLQCDTSAMSFTLAVLLSDEDVRAILDICEKLNPKKSNVVS